MLPPLALKEARLEVCNPRLENVTGHSVLPRRDARIFNGRPLLTRPLKQLRHTGEETLGPRVDDEHADGPQCRIHIAGGKMNRGEAVFIEQFVHFQTTWEEHINASEIVGNVTKWSIFLVGCCSHLFLLHLSAYS